MLAIVDYGVGNLFSLKSSFARIGASACVTGDADELRRADRIILPGVGAFGDAAKKLRESGLASVVTEEARQGKPLLGICLGMQLLFEKSYEYGEHAGLGLLPGSVRPIAPVIGPGRKVPHIGWNVLSLPGEQAEIPAVCTGGCRANAYISSILSQQWNAMPSFLPQLNTAYRSPLRPSLEP